jgi:hypothetical protein
MDGFVAAVGPYSFLLLLVILNIPVLYRILIAWPVLTITHLLLVAFGMPGGAL